MADYQIAFFDIDGTLVDQQSKAETFMGGVPDSTKLAIKKVKEAGIIPVIATGRGKHGVDELAEGLEIDNIIASNGQEIIYHQEEIYHCCIEQRIINDLYEEFPKRKVSVLFETREGVFAMAEQTDIVAKKVPIQFLEPGEIPTDVLQMIVRTDTTSELQEWLTELKVVKVAVDAVNILPFGASKASGIHLMLEKLGIPVENSLGFGDEENDLEMFDAVGTAVAMGNATPDLKAKADFITKEVWNDGIYHACEVLKLF